MIALQIKTIGEQIISRLRGELLRGAFSPGSPLREEEIAERFGVSRVPVRHVFQELVHEGLLVAKRSKGVSVAHPLSDHAWSALTPVRHALEIYALKHWFDNRCDYDVSPWDRVLANMRTACESKDHDTIIDLDIAFHDQLFRIAGLEELLPVWRPAMTLLRSYHLRQNQRRELGSLIAIHAIHQELLTLFKGRDFAVAEVALTSHLTDGKFNQKIRASFAAKEGNAQKTKGKCK